MTLKSRGLMAWLWLFKNASQAKAAMKPSFGPAWLGLFKLGLARLTALGRNSTNPRLTTITLEYLVIIQ
jgi:hypothetical protein